MINIIAIVSFIVAFGLIARGVQIWIHNLRNPD